jgi:hypothetical protein
MPKTADDTAFVATYPPKKLKQQWCDHADMLDMSLSRYIIKMVEAGRATIEIESSSNDEISRLQQQARDQRRELQRSRKRIRDLEHQLERTAVADIEQFVADNPGAGTPEIIQHVADTVPSRVVGYLDLLEGEAIHCRDDRYYPSQSVEGETAVDDVQSPDGGEE